MKPNLRMALKTVKILYDRNFEMLTKTQGTPAQKYYIKQEQKLERQYTRIQQKLGEYIDDLCPIASKLPCYECTGWYGVVIYRRNKAGKPVYHMTKVGNGRHCNTK